MLILGPTSDLYKKFEILPLLPQEAVKFSPLFLPYSRIDKYLPSGNTCSKTDKENRNKLISSHRSLLEWFFEDFERGVTDIDVYALTELSDNLEILLNAGVSSCVECT